MLSLHAIKLHVRKLVMRQLSVSGAELLDEGRVYLYFNALHIDPLGRNHRGRRAPCQAA